MTPAQHTLNIITILRESTVLSPLHLHELNARASLLWFLTLNLLFPSHLLSHIYTRGSDVYSGANSKPINLGECRMTKVIEKSIFADARRSLRSFILARSHTMTLSSEPIVPFAIYHAQNLRAFKSKKCASSFERSTKERKKSQQLGRQQTHSTEGEEDLLVNQRGTLIRTFRTATATVAQRYNDENHYASGELSRGNELLNIRVNTLTRAKQQQPQPSMEREPIYERSTADNDYSDYESISDL